MPNRCLPHCSLAVNIRQEVKARATLCQKVLTSLQLLATVQDKGGKSCRANLCSGPARGAAKPESRGWKRSSAPLHKVLPSLPEAQWRTESKVSCCSGFPCPGHRLFHFEQYLFFPTNTDFLRSQAQQTVLFVSYRTYTGTGSRSTSNALITKNNKDMICTTICNSVRQWVIVSRWKLHLTQKFSPFFVLTENKSHFPYLKGKWGSVPNA